MFALIEEDGHIFVMHITLATPEELQNAITFLATSEQAIETRDLLLEHRVREAIDSLLGSYYEDEIDKRYVSLKASERVWVVSKTIFGHLVYHEKKTAWRHESVVATGLTLDEAKQFINESAGK